uniref:Uncharacterized protein n=1 Tax=Anopheles arabiensis TaxID=7173 RepID=A0A182HJP8_ANOAR
MAPVVLLSTTLTPSTDSTPSSTVSRWPSRLSPQLPSTLPRWPTPPSPRLLPRTLLTDTQPTARPSLYNADPINGFNAVVHREPLAVKAVAPIAKYAAPLAYPAVAKVAAPYAPYGYPAYGKAILG